MSSVASFRRENIAGAVCIIPYRSNPWIFSSGPKCPPAVVFVARFCSRTLLAAQILEEEVHKACDSAMHRLLEHNFIVKSTVGESGEDCADYGVAPTQLGRVSRSSIARQPRDGTLGRLLKYLTEVSVNVPGNRLC